jgi:hypothetical protein
MLSTTHAIRRNALVALLAALFALAGAGQALADSSGYEGQPGNQSQSHNNNNKNNNNGNGQSGYEGQPGNQGGH